VVGRTYSEYLVQKSGLKVTARNQGRHNGFIHDNEGLHYSRVPTYLMYKSIDDETQSTCKLATNIAVVVAAVVTDLVLLKRVGLLRVKSRDRQIGGQGSG